MARHIKNEEAIGRETGKRKFSGRFRDFQTALREQDDLIDSLSLPTPDRNKLKSLLAGHLRCLFWLNGRTDA